MNRQADCCVSTGLRGLDAVVAGLRLGDNVVWSADSTEAYDRFVEPYVASAIVAGREVLYLRFAQHPPLSAAACEGVEMLNLDAGRGFEAFTSEIHHLIRQRGREVFYVFDCLSDLLSAWATDRMIGYFFQVTCPYLNELDTLAYFAILRGGHSFATIDRIRRTTQVLLGLHHQDGQLIVHPLKVEDRHSPTMFLPHVQEGHRFVPIANSHDATRMWSAMATWALGDAERNLDYWDRLFLEAERLRAPDADPQRRQALVNQLCRMIISPGGRILELAQRYFSIEDLLEIRSRMIGTGYIGGKAVGMLLARRILSGDQQRDWSAVLEPHDSFYVGSDVFYSYLVHNGLWRLLMEHKTEAGYDSAARALHERMLHGEFTPEIEHDLRQMLEYFGQYPIVVRSSSLLEDGFGSAFAGKYDSFFCVNQGSPDQRYARVAEAVRRIFASTMSDDAIAYRKQRGLHQQEEPMGLLFQRVSGRYRDRYYMPDLAGVGVSYNTFVWNRDMDPRAGMLRLVMGLGTRAVDRIEGDYPAVIALDQPGRKPHKDLEDVRRFSQHDVDVIDVEANELCSRALSTLVAEGIDLPLSECAVRTEPSHTERSRQRHGAGTGASGQWLLTFEPLFRKYPVAGTMQGLLKTLEAAYDHPVDVEFTINFRPEGGHNINLVQCRPLQTFGSAEPVRMPETPPAERVLFQSEGGFMGGNISLPIDRVIWIDPARYTALSNSDRYEVARIVGRLNALIGENGSDCRTMLIGPGRWGTTTPSLGVPVRFSEINRMAVLVEVAMPISGMRPDLSFGSHFFQDLVETSIFYVALFDHGTGPSLNTEWLAAQPRIGDQPEGAAGPAREAVAIHDTTEAKLRLVADVVSQRLLCHAEAATRQTVPV